MIFIRFINLEIVDISLCFLQFPSNYEFELMTLIFYSFILDNSFTYDRNMCNLENVRGNNI